MKSIIASAIILFAFAGIFAVVSLVRTKVMGPSAPHSCTDGCSSCKSRCENYDPEELKREIQESLDLKNEK